MSIGSTDTRGTALRAARDAIGMTQGQVMEITGISAHAQGRYERGEAEAPAKLYYFYVRQGFSFENLYNATPVNNRDLDEEDIERIAEKALFLAISKGASFDGSKPLSRVIEIMKDAFKWGLAYAINRDRFNNSPRSV